MTMIEMYVTDSAYLNAEQTSENTWTIHLSNGEDIPIEKTPVHNGSVWSWRIGTSIFGNSHYAYKYLCTLVTEKLTGRRIIHHAKFLIFAGLRASPAGVLVSAILHCVPIVRLLRNSSLIEMVWS